jgi:transcriptional regulator with XRE-family HTH domain
MDALHRSLARRIKHLMRAKGLSVNRLADFSGIGRGRMSEILAAKSSPTVRTLARIADALDVRVADLFTGEMDDSKPA